jgi:hypothetical protein
MATWVSSVIIPICVSVAGTIATGLTVGPRLAARAKRIQAYHHDARDKFTDSILDIVGLCSNLHAVLANDVTEESRSKLQDERNRWESQIGDITMWLVDHWQRYALGYLATAGVRDLVQRYAATTRGIWISARPLQERIGILNDLSQPMLTIFVMSRWRAVNRIEGEVDRLSEMLDSLQKPAPPEQPEKPPQKHSGNAMTAGQADPSGLTHQPGWSP